jgi:NAD(P)-dependent dehydrogenase (short-subunit alcohol dehydrogenase family)
VTRFVGRVAVVTGGAQGMGRAVAERLVAEGASVVIGDVDGDLARRTAGEIAARDPDRVVAVEGDVARRSDVQAMVAAAVDTFGGLDVMVAHAGIGLYKPFFDHDEATFESTLAVNVIGAFLCIQEAAKVMRDSGGGAIVVTGSTNATWIETNLAAYNASKGGVVALVRSAAIDLAPSAIRVNSVAPGLIRTRLTRHVTEDVGNAADYLRGIPLGRFGEPGDVAAAICFLASDDASWITGHDLVIDGGQTIGTPIPLPD